MKVPFVDLAKHYRLIKPDVLAAMESVLDSGNYILGEEVERFEEAMAEYVGCRYVLAVANGTDALILAFKAFGIGPGDEVIVPANSFIASAGAVAMVGAKPIFCDVRNDLNIDTDLIDSLITDNTKAIMPVHLTGRPVQMKPIWNLAKQYNLRIIEDTAQAIGAKLDGKMTGNLGDIGCFSLHPLKNLSVYGDGGLMTMNDESLYHYIKRLRNHGLKDRDTCLHWGLNSRLDAIQACVAKIGLQHLDHWTKRHRQIAERYCEGLKMVVNVPVEFPGCFAVYHNFVLLTDKRDQLQHYLGEQGIETKIHYPIPLHVQPAAEYLGYKLGDFPNTERYAKEMLSLPIYPELDDQEVDFVIEKILAFYSVKIGLKGQCNENAY